MVPILRTTTIFYHLPGGQPEVAVDFSKAIAANSSSPFLLLTQAGTTFSTPSAALERT